MINVATGAQVPGSLVFHQAANTTGADTISQIDYVARARSSERDLPDRVRPGGQGPRRATRSRPCRSCSSRRSPSCLSPQPPLVENFDTSNPGGTTGAAAWTGDGFLRATFPVELTGTGVDGAFNPPVGP